MEGIVLKVHKGGVRLMLDFQWQCVKEFSRRGTWLLNASGMLICCWCWE